MVAAANLVEVAAPWVTLRGALGSELGWLKSVPRSRALQLMTSVTADLSEIFRIALTARVCRPVGHATRDG
jgi:hypothetical protein